MTAELSVVYVCRQCFSTDIRPGPCPEHDEARVECDPGDPDSPCRRPPMDAQGRIVNRAPLWWVMKCAPFMKEYLQS